MKDPEEEDDDDDDSDDDDNNITTNNNTIWINKWIKWPNNNTYIYNIGGVMVTNYIWSVLSYNDWVRWVY